MTTRLLMWVQVLIAGLMAGIIAPAAAEEAQPTMGAHGLMLPATFTGDLPCADCEGIRYHLNLWPDQVFALRRSWLGKPTVVDAMGRWSVDAERRALILWDVGEKPLEFQILNNQRLRLLDTEGKPIVSQLPYELAGQDTLQLLDVHLLMSGMFVYFADAARLTECRTGRNFPVAMEGDFLALQRAYMGARKDPAQPLMVSLEGSIEPRARMEGGGTEEAVIVKRFINVWPGETCERNRADATLKNTYWRIVKIGDQTVTGKEGHREPHLLLLAGEPRFAATVGCNQMIGGVEAAGNAITFQAGPMTMMACPPPLDQWEHRFIEVLTATKGWAINGQMLEFRDASGKPVALFQAVYLR